MLNVIDEFTRECIAIRVSRKLKATDVIDVLSDLFILRGIPGHFRSDNGRNSLPRRSVNVSRCGRYQNRLHYAWKPMGEWLLRELQLKASRRAAQW